MANKNLNNNDKWSNTIIFFVATLFFYFLISFVMNTFVYREVEFSIKESNDMQKYISGNIIDLENLVASGGEENFHYAAIDYDTQMKSLCNTYDYFCNKIQIDTRFDLQSEFLYQALTVKNLDFIDQKLSHGSAMRNTIEKIDINKEEGARRWQSSWYKTVLNTETMEGYSEYFYVTSHELGHIVDLWSLRGNVNQRNEDFTEFGKVIFREDDPSIEFYKISWESEKVRKKDSSKKDFCSGYGMYNPFEDFAECFNLYINFNDSFRQIASENDILQKKFDHIATLFDSNYLFDNDDVLREFEENESRRPWDTTKI